MARGASLLSGFLDLIGKRRFIRVTPRVDERIEIQLMGTGFLEILRAKDVSEGGVGIVVPHSFRGYDLDGEMVVLITLPGARVFQAAGKLRHSSTSTDTRVFGFEFSELSDLARGALQSYVRRRVEEDHATSDKEL